jgi:2-octaprenylphenol hydroxylase
MHETFDVMIVGGGVIGLCAAIAMRQRNVSVAVLDAGSLTNGLPNPRVYALNQASQQLLQKLDIWPAVDKARISPYTHMHVWDASNAACIDFDARMIASEQLGVIIEESVIKQALLQLAVEHGVVLYPHSTVNTVHYIDDAIRVSDHEKHWYAKLLMVADGAQSATRQLLNVSVTSWPYHQHAIVTTVHTKQPHQQTAYQVFNADGPLAFLPLVDPHQCSIVWSTSPGRAQQLLNLSDMDFSHAITQAFAAKLGASEVIDKRYQFPLHLRHAKQYSGPHWLLMGDAAHTIHPLAGLGLNVGLADLSVWLEQLDSSKKSMWSQKMLGAYQRQRKYDVWQIIALMEGLKLLFANPLPPVKLLRGLGITTCNGLPALKRMLIKYAAGID